MPLVSAHEDRVEIKLVSSLASIQGKKARRNHVTAELSTISAAVPFLFSGDVSVTIQLWLSEQERYETDRSADIDNVIKPLLDGLIGPSGVMIDDNQVQNVQCYWIQHVDAPAAMITIENTFRERVSKEKLLFVHMGNQLYFPIQGFLTGPIKLKMLDMLETYRAGRVKLESLGLDYHDLRYAMPIQRYFHKTRIPNFRKLEFDEARREFAGA